MDAPVQFRQIIRNLPGNRGGITDIVAGYDLQQEGTVGHGLAERADLVQGRGIGHQTVAGHPAVGRLQADDPAMGGRLPDGPTGIRTQGAQTFPGGHRGR